MAEAADGPGGLLGELAITPSGLLIPELFDPHLIEQRGKEWVQLVVLEAC